MGCGASFLSGDPNGSVPPVEREYRTLASSLRNSNSLSDESIVLGSIRVFNDDFRNVKDDYIFGRILGKGQFGTCRLVTYRTSGLRCACKSILKRRLTCVSDVAAVRREVAIMHHLGGHPNIISLKDVYEDATSVHMVQELCSGGELFDSIVERGHYSERDAASVFRSVASVVAHCHNMGVIHRDIKPENFLLSNRSPNAVVKGTDFGLSLFFAEGQTFRQVVGSPFYVAPEVLRKQYDKRADIWSLGVLLYILLSGTPPFSGETDKGTFRAIVNAPLSFTKDPWPSISRGAKDIIRRMLNRDVSRRPTASEVLSHEWVREGGVTAAGPLQHEVVRRLKNFAALNKLQQEALKVIATQLPDNEVCGLRALFKEMDADGSGGITVEELRQALRRKGTQIPAAELASIVARADISGDGTLDYEEFLAATMNLDKLDSDLHMYTAFRFFCSDDSGYITHAELAAALSHVCGPEEIESLMAQADRSGDGRIDYKEFCELMRSNLTRASEVQRHGIRSSTQSQRSSQTQFDSTRLRMESLTSIPLTATSSTPPPPPPPTASTTPKQSIHGASQQIKPNASISRGKTTTPASPAGITITTLASPTATATATIVPISPIRAPSSTSPQLPTPTRLHLQSHPRQEQHPHPHSAQELGSRVALEDAGRLQGSVRQRKGTESGGRGGGGGEGPEGMLRSSVADEGSMSRRLGGGGSGGSMSAKGATWSGGVAVVGNGTTRGLGGGSGGVGSSSSSSGGGGAGGRREVGGCGGVSGGKGNTWSGGADAAAAAAAAARPSGAVSRKSVGQLACGGKSGGGGSGEVDADGGECPGVCWAAPDEADRSPRPRFSSGAAALAPVRLSLDFRQGQKQSLQAESEIVWEVEDGVRAMSFSMGGPCQCTEVERMGSKSGGKG